MFFWAGEAAKLKLKGRPCGEKFKWEFSGEAPFTLIPPKLSSR
jgi:hypothetical protein